MGDRPGRDERVLAVGAVRVLAFLVIPAGALGGVAAGWSGAASAVIGLGFVLVLFGGSALLLAWAADRSPGAALGVLLGGVWVRLVLYFGALSVLMPLPWVHEVSLALATGLGVAATLAHELRLIARTPRLFWVDADAARPSAVSNATRSQTL